MSLKYIGHLTFVYFELFGIQSRTQIFPPTLFSSSRGQALYINKRFHKDVRLLLE